MNCIWSEKSLWKIIAIIFHNDFSDQMQFISFMKNIALSGGFLFLVVNGAKGYCLDKK